MTGAAEAIVDPRQAASWLSPYISVPASNMLPVNPSTGRPWTDYNIKDFGRGPVNRDTGEPATAYPSMSRLIGSKLPGLSYIQQRADYGRVPYDASPFASGPYMTNGWGDEVKSSSPVPPVSVNPIDALTGLPKYWLNRLDQTGPMLYPDRGEETRGLFYKRFRSNAMSGYDGGE
jgi:hypothetical protein